MIQLSSRAKQTIGIFFRVALSAVLLIYIFNKIDVGQTWAILKEADLSFLYLAFFVSVGIYLFSLVRWYVIIQALGLSLSFKNVARYFGIGIFSNLFLPTSTGGDFVKTIGLFQYTPDKAKVVASVLLDRIFGLIAIIGLAFIALIIGYSMINDPSLLWAVVVLGFLLVIGILFLYHEGAYSWACRLFNRLPRVKEELMKLHYALALIKRQYRVYAIMLMVSLVMQILLAVSFYFTARGFHQEVTLLSCLIFTPLICIAGTFPSMGGLGVRDISAVFLFAKVGVQAGTAASMSLLNFLFIVIIGCAGALCYVFTLPDRRIQRDS